MTETDVIKELDLASPWDQSDYVIGPAEMTARWLKANPAVLVALLDWGEPLAAWRVARKVHHVALAAYRDNKTSTYPWHTRDALDDAMEALWEVLDAAVPE